MKQDVYPRTYDDGHFDAQTYHDGHFGDNQNSNPITYGGLPFQWQTRRNPRTHG